MLKNIKNPYKWESKSESPNFIFGISNFHRGNFIFVYSNLLSECIRVELPFKKSEVRFFSSFANYNYLFVLLSGGAPKTYFWKDGDFEA